MDDNTKQAVRLLVDAVEENDEGGPKFSGSDNVKVHDCLIPEVLEAINLDDDALRISRDRIESELGQALLNCKNHEDIITEFQSEIDAIESRLREEDTEQYRIAFPLNFDHRSKDLLPDEMQIGEVTFRYIDRNEWRHEYVPSSDDIPEDADIKMGDPEHMIHKLEQFLERSPNNISNLHYTYWESEYYARDRKYAVNAVEDVLQILLGELNYAINFNVTEGISTTNGPWPHRWSELRCPFIYLVYDSSGTFLEYYYDSEDPTPRESEKPHSFKDELFQEVFSNTPDFGDDEPLDRYLKKAFKSYQTAITNPSDREGFFGFWRAIELLTLSKPQESSKVAVERAEALFDWNNPELVEIRTHRAIRKRNEHVHDGQGSEIRRNDKNMLKLLTEGLIDHYIERRSKWNISQMRFSLEYLTTDRDSINQLVQDREEELEVLEWMEDISEN